ncbi:DUF6236 family protein [Photobacterium phosphoreum]|uniref:DUF6236 family protein n=1 Tax=Photobacterium phosphoreum TaxID=659 RepID=UPI000D163A06|nr:DUF6236 family protein [Photobacterium phosphoreum]PSU66018.1 hypothetical protein CTM75_02860 [Photobacterium phosphoreum]
MKERGIIVTPPVTIKAGGGLYVESSEITDHQIRMAVFFWDKFDWPDNNLISMGNGETNDLLFLKECGIFNRTRININNFSGGAGTALLQIQDLVVKEKNKIEPGNWSIQRIGDELISSPSFTQPKKVIEFDLYNSIPLPSSDVPLNDILEFKEKHKSELLAFRMLMDEMYLNIINSPDQLSAKSAALLRLSVSISDLHKSMKSASIKRSLLSYRVVLNDFSDMWDTITRGYGAYELVKTTVGDDLAAVLGAANALFKISAKQAPVSKNLPAALKDYAYLSKIERDFM